MRSIDRSAEYIWWVFCHCQLHCFFIRSTTEYSMHLATSSKALRRNVVHLFHMKRTRLEKHIAVSCLFLHDFFLSGSQTSSFVLATSFSQAQIIPGSLVQLLLIDRRIDSPVSDEGYQCYLHSNGVHACIPAWRIVSVSCLSPGANWDLKLVPLTTGSYAAILSNPTNRR